MNYNELAAQMTGRNSTRRKLANNTYAEKRGNGIAVRLHGTDILTFAADGKLTVTSGGWKTVTTKARLTARCPCQGRGIVSIAAW